ncbi:hypothetical protein [Embleya sp. NPDC001921]
MTSASKFRDRNPGERSPTLLGSGRIVRRIVAILFLAATFFVFQGTHSSFAGVAKPAGNPTLRPQEPPFDTSCTWMPDNVAGTWWYYFCPAADVDGRVSFDRVPGTYIIGGEKAQDDMDRWVRESRVKGEALRNSVGPPTPGMKEQQSSFTMPGSEGTLDPCDLMKGEFGTEKRPPRAKKTCLNVKNLLEQRENPCAQILNRELVGACDTLHKESWAKMTRPIDFEVLPPCGTPNGSICAGASTKRWGPTADMSNETFTDDPIRWIRAVSQDTVNVTMMWWVTAPDPIISKNGDDCSPDVEPVMDRRKSYPCSGNTVDFLVRHTNIFTYGLSILCVVLAGVKLAFSRDVSSVKDAIKGVLILVLVAGSSVFLVNAAVRMSQAYCDWIIVEGLNTDGTGGSDPDQAIQVAVGRFSSGLQELTSFPVFMMAVIVLVPSNMVQFFYMTLRLILVMVLTGTLPLAAAASSTEQGMRILRYHISGLAAFILIKPASITILVAGAKLWTPPGGVEMQWADQFRGLFILVAVTWLCPAIVRIVFTVTGPAAGSSGANSGASAFALATGARVVAIGANVVRHR